MWREILKQVLMLGIPVLLDTIRNRKSKHDKCNDCELKIEEISQIERARQKAAEAAKTQSQHESDR